MLSKDFDTATGLTIPSTQWYQSLAAAGLQNPDVYGPARHWLQVEGSFTKALQKKCRSGVQVDVIREGFAEPSDEEARRLSIPRRQKAWIREVQLCGDGQPWVLARTIIPVSCLEGRGRRLLNLGNKPLGAYLFSSPDWARGPLETGLCQTELAHQPQLARRSLFHCGQTALMVCEFLLPALYQPDHPL